MDSFEVLWESFEKRNNLLSQKYSKPSHLPHTILNMNNTSSKTLVPTNQIKLLVVENERLRKNVGEILRYMKQEENHMKHNLILPMNNKIREMNSLKGQNRMLNSEIRAQKDQNLKLTEKNTEFKIEISEYKKKLEKLEGKLNKRETLLRRNSKFSILASPVLTDDLEKMYRIKINNLIKKNKQILDAKTLIKIENNNLRLQNRNLKKDLLKKETPDDGLKSEISTELNQIKLFISNLNKMPTKDGENEVKLFLNRFNKFQDDFGKKIDASVHQNSDLKSMALQVNSLKEENFKLKQERDKAMDNQKQDQSKSLKEALKKLENQLKNKDQDLQSKNRLFDEQNNMLKNLKSKMESKKKEVKTLRSDLIIREKEITKLEILSQSQKEKVNFENYKSILDNLKSDLKGDNSLKELSLSKNILEAINKNQNQNKEIMDMKRALLENKESLKKEIENLKAQIFDQKLKVNNLNNQNLVKTQSIAQLETTLSEYKERIKEKDRKIQDLENKLKFKNKEIEKIEAKLSQNPKLDQTQMVFLQEKEKQLKERETELKDFKKNILEEIQSQRNFNLQQQPFVHSVYDNFNSPPQRFKNVHMSVQSPDEFDMASNKVMRMKKITQELLDKLKAQKDKYQELKEKLDKTKKKKNKLKDQLYELKNENMKLKNEMELFKAIEKDKETKFNYAEREKKNLEESFYDMEKKLKETKNELNDKIGLERQLKELRENEEFLKEMNKNREIQIIALERDKEDQEEILHKYVNQSELQSQRPNTHFKTLKKKNLKLKNFVLDLREAYISLQDQNNDLETKIEEEIQLREEIIESFHENVEKFEQKIYEFDEFKENLSILREKFKEAQKSGQ